MIPWHRPSTAGIDLLAVSCHDWAETAVDAAEPFVHALGQSVHRVRLADLEPMSRTEGATAADPHGFTGRVARAAAEHDARMILITAPDLPQMEAIKALAHASGRPVLLARKTPGAAERVLVATSLAPSELPVVAFGVALAWKLGAAVTVMHNVATADGAVHSLRSEREGELRARASEVAGAGVEVDALAMSAPSIEHAILELAATLRPALLVVGSYPRSDLTAWLIPSVCSAVLKRATTSVAVLPFVE